MSHRLTIETQITDREAARAALKQANISFEERGDIMYLKTGPYRDTQINLKTGFVTSGDTDFNRIDRGKLGLLRQYYAEAKYRLECAREGVQIVDRREEIVNGEKIIVLRCQTG